MAGLVGGDSDSSALTQESGDEGLVGTPITGTDGGTDNAEDEDIGMHEVSRGMFLSFSLHWTAANQHVVQHFLHPLNQLGAERKEWQDVDEAPPPVHDLPPRKENAARDRL